MRRLAFVTGTRADYGKIKPLMKAAQDSGYFSIDILVTGMHLLPQYGSTVGQVIEDALGEVHFLPNQLSEQTMEISLAKTIEQLSSFVSDHQVDLLIVHGDRIEALAGAIVGALRNVPTAHIEGGEVSGTVDGLIRHSVSKLCHIHFVSNQEAQSRLIQLGENPNSIFVIGSPDIDVMLGDGLPSKAEVLQRYDIPFENYSILIFHPVTTEVEKIEAQISEVVHAIEYDTQNYVIIKPNNDNGSETIQKHLSKLIGRRFVHIPSMRFEYFLTLLKESRSIVGNSSAGVREAPYYGIPTVNIGSRQLNRAVGPQIFNVAPVSGQITQGIESALKSKREVAYEFGRGNAADKFIEILISDEKWPIGTDKVFIDVRN